MTTSAVHVFKPRVLVVDDVEDNITLLRDVLESQYDLTTAQNGKDALRLACATVPPELILLDIRMPGMDGFEVMRRLRADPATASIPVIFLSALASPEDEEEGLVLGAVDFIHKPINPTVALARIRNHLARSGSTRKLQTLADQLGRYVAPQVCQSLLDGSRNTEIQTQHKKLTVFFSDIKDFTAATDRWEPEDVTFLLNSYFSEMSRIAHEYGGTLDKFIGDAMLIFFGDPGTLGAREDALQCVRMAQAMQRRMGELQLLWRQLGADKAFQIRIGITTGFCNVGNFGCNSRMDYTIIGSPVNMAARLEEAAAPGGIVMARETYELVQGEFRADASGPLRLKGFAEPVNAYVLRDDVAPAAASTLPVWAPSVLQIPLLTREREPQGKPAHCEALASSGVATGLLAAPERSAAGHLH